MGRVRFSFSARFIPPQKQTGADQTGHRQQAHEGCACAPCSANSSTAPVTAPQKNSDMMIAFASIDPLITPGRWMKYFEDAGFKPEVMPGILKDNAVGLPGLA